MGFVEANKMFFKRYFDFSGRSTRPEIWWPFLTYWIVFVVLYIVPSIFVGISGNTGTASEMVAAIPILFFVLFWFAVLIPGIAVRVRRFHDQGQSGWMYLLRLIPLVGGLVIIIFMCLEGERGANRFGPSPLEEDISTTFE